MYVMLPYYNGGCHLCLDVCIISSLQAQFVQGAAAEPDHALQHRYDVKWREYRDLYQAEGLVFKAMPLEMLGDVHETSVDVVQRVNQSLVRDGGQEKGEDTRYLFGRLSILL